MYLPRMSDGKKLVPTGRWFDEFSLGQSIESAGRTVTESDVASFAGLSGDFNPIHIDAEHARRSVFRQRIAHGLLVESIASGLAHGTGIFEGTISALAEIEIQFRKPVFFGDTVRLLLKVTDIDDKPGPKRGYICFSTTVTNQSGEIVIEGSWKVIFLRDRNRGTLISNAKDSQ
ncbi:MAG: acyl dehydratase [Planctomycetota bacterium]|jgi:acyl dehydratase